MSAAPSRDHLTRFANVTARGGPFIRALCERFQLAGQRAVSIASGTCAEEIVMAGCGVAVDCIEPIAGQLDIARDQAARLAPAGAIAFHNCVQQAFHSERRYALIYTSCPQDWMSADFRSLVPDDYLAFFARFAAPRCVLVVRLWSASYSRDVLTAGWFPKALAERFRTASDFRLREYWLSGTGRRALIVCTSGYSDAPLADGAGFAAAADRFGDSAALKFCWPEDARVQPSPLERLTPHVLALRHGARAIRDRIRRPPQTD